MDHSQTVIRTKILAGHFVSNLAYANAQVLDGKLITPDTKFWRSMWVNCIELAVLDWCKLFADSKHGKHYWNKSITLDWQVAYFKESLSAATEMTEEEFSAYIHKMRKLRDKFIAHLDELDDMYIPELYTARCAAICLVDFLNIHVDHQKDEAPEVPTDLQSMYDEALASTRQHFRTIFK